MTEHIKLNHEGEKLFQDGDYDGAQAAFLRAIEITPTYTEAHNNLGILFLQKRDINNAIHHLHNALTIDPLFKPAIMNLCVLLINSGDLKNAVNICMTYLKHNPNDRDIDNLISGIAETEVGRVAKRYISVLRFEDKLLEFLSFIEPFVKVEIGRLYFERIGHMAGDTDLYLRRRQLFGSPPNTVQIFIAGKPANQQLLDMFKKHVNIVQDESLLYLYEACEKFRKSKYFMPLLHFEPNEQGDFKKGRATLKFTEEEETKGKKYLLEMGLGENDWFVCIHARDTAYMTDQYPHDSDSNNSYRNADINTYKKSIDYIVEMGGFVIRVGAMVNAPLHYNNKRVIDYATYFRNEFMDIYLAAKCKFFLGAPCGICDTSGIFDVPFLAVNWTSFGTLPYNRNDLCLFIPKIVKKLDTGEPLPFSTFISEFNRHWDWASLFNGNRHYDLGYIHEDNSEEEIFEVTKEMFERMNGTFLQSDHDKELINKYYNLYEPDHCFSSLAKDRPPIGRDFLRRYEHLIC